MRESLHAPPRRGVRPGGHPGGAASRRAALCIVARGCRCGGTPHTGSPGPWPWPCAWRPMTLSVPSPDRRGARADPRRRLRRARRRSQAAPGRGGRAGGAGPDHRCRARGCSPVSCGAGPSRWLTSGARREPVGPGGPRRAGAGRDHDPAHADGFRMRPGNHPAEPLTRPPRRGVPDAARAVLSRVRSAARTGEVLPPKPRRPTRPSTRRRRRAGGRLLQGPDRTSAIPLAIGGAWTRLVNDQRVAHRARRCAGAGHVAGDRRSGQRGARHS